MKMKEILQSNFKHYRFVIYKNDATQTHFKFEIKLKKIKAVGLGELDLCDKEDLPNHYDIGYSLQKISNGKISVEHVASFIDTTKIFKFRKLEYVPSEETLYIHCKLNKK